MPRSTKKTKGAPKKELELYLRVLGYTKKDGIWAAHCLETDLVGYGKSFRRALNELIELTEMQLNFALFKNQRALLDRPAPADIIEIYNRLMRSNLQLATTKPSKVDPKRRITSIPLPPKPLKSDFGFAQV